jgi:sulfur relay (sulfurtransferase) DsrF/TusC family protein
MPTTEDSSAGINHPANINEDLRRRMRKARTFAVREDLEERGINQHRCISEVQLIRRADVPALMDDYEQVWHW